jgi:hypothetical protein
MATESNRQLILAALIARLELIQTANGYQTDAGLHVYTHEAPALGPDDEHEAIALIPQDDEPGYQGEQVFLILPVDVQALTKWTDASERPYLQAERILADVKKAMEPADRSFGRLLKSRIERGSTKTLLREQGSLTIGVAVSYRLPYVEVWGEP